VSVGGERVRELGEGGVNFKASGRFNVPTCTISSPR
jgi:hypothetical protein